MFEVISRDSARAQGLPRFFTGKPCKYGHLAQRFVSGRVCCECQKINSQKFAARHPDRIEANRAVQRAKSPDYFREYYQRNSSKRKSQARDWYGANRGRAQEVNQAWRERNPDKSRAIQQACSHRRRAREASAPGFHTAADLRRIYERQKGKCPLCRNSFAKVGSELDHIIPLARGGSNDPSNLQYLCTPCNRAKHAKDPIEFAQERGLLL
jgi:5-methylcytosine-specific restriction endonuclease McrA